MNIPLLIAIWSAFSALFGLLIGYQISATRIWKIFVGITEDFPDDKMSDWTETLKENPPKLF